jgi:serine/threonine protein kinase
MSRTQRLAAPETFGKYQLIARLAQGRMGDVYKAKSHGLEGFERILVIKTIQPGLAAVPGFVDIVVEEAQKAVALSHANVAQVIDLGREDQGQRVYIATEFINGLDLARARNISRLAQIPWPPELSVFIGAEIAQGLDHAHRRKDFNFNPLNLLHCNLTPGNILIGQDGAVKITDFGISRALQITSPIDNNDLKRRCRYMAPEIVRGMPYSPRADIFSLGLILYELFSGQHPYELDDVDAVVQLAASGQITPLSNFPNIPRPLAQIVDSMLVPDPNGRTSSAGQVYEELVGFIFGNNLSADARVLGMLIQELRKEEIRLFPEEVSKEVGLDEISMSDLRIPKEAQSLYGEEEETNHLAPSSEATRDALPRQKLDQSFHPDDSQGTPLPGALEDYFRASRSGQGKTVLLYGSPGAGKDYLPDRLVSALGTRGNTFARSVQACPDDAIRPFGVMGDALVQLLRDRLTPGVDPYRGALDALAQLGLAEPAQQLFAALWGIAPGPRYGYAQRQQLLLSAWTDLLDLLCQRSTVVLIIDQIEHLDPVSMELLKNLVPIVGQRPAMLILATELGERMRQTLDTGNAQQLGSAKIVGPEPPRIRDLHDLDDDQREILSALAIWQRPMSHTELALLLQIPNDRAMNAIKALVTRGAVRVPTTGLFLAGMAELGLWNEQTFGKQGVQRRAANLARLARNRTRNNPVDRLTPTLIRLLAVSGDRRRLLQTSAAYITWLHNESWLHSAMICYRRVAELIGSESLGIPQEQVTHLLARAELALDLSLLDECRASLAPITTLAERSRYERGLIRGLILLAHMELQADDVEAAHRHLSRAIDAAHGLRAPDLLARAQTALAAWHERFGDELSGQKMIESAINLCDRTDSRPIDPLQRATMLNLAVNLWCTRGMAKYAQRAADDLHTIASSSKLVAIECRAQWAQARILGSQGHTSQARKLVEQALHTAQAHNLTSLRIDLMRQLATLALHDNDPAQAYALCAELATLAASHQDAYSQQRAQDMQALAACLLKQDAQNALNHLHSSLQRASSRKVPKDIRRCHAFLHQALTSLGRHQEAQQHLLLSSR